MRSYVLSAVLFFAGLSSSDASVLIQVDQATQKMSVAVDGVPVYRWAVSTGKPGYETPNGNFKPNRLDADHHSDEYDSAPMPYSIFFDLRGHAIHGTYERIGRPGASHGCVRLTPANARTLFELVQQQGLQNVRVEIEGDVRTALRTEQLSAPLAQVPRRQRGERRRGARYAQPYDDDAGDAYRAAPNPYDARPQTSPFNSWGGSSYRPW